MRIITLLIFFLLFISNANSQNTIDLTNTLIQKNVLTQREADSLATIATFNEKINSQNKLFVIGLEFRPRVEFRNGYKQLRNDTSSASYFGTHRSRLNLSYSQSNFKFYTSIQDVRVWGEYGQVSINGSLNVFEAYVETYFTDNLFLRLGRQKVELDNGRLFSAANWSQASKAHDGINLVFKNKKTTSELMTYFNQTAERLFETNYAPTSFSNYKLLNVHYFKTQITPQLSLTTINATDGYESKANQRVMYMRGTSGGSINYEKANLLLTINGYYQYGKLQTGKKIAAYYLQPEAQIKIKKLNIHLGAEFLSGDDATKITAISNSFVPLYGVAWKFMGNMDYFTSFPNDVKNGGLLNPYLFLIYNVTTKFSVRADSHLFYLQNKVLDKSKNAIKPYLGFENDLSLKYVFNDFTMLDFGFSYLIAEKSMETLKGGNSNKIPIWSYVMVTFKPELFKSK